jgi:hypothetical protein
LQNHYTMKYILLLAVSFLLLMPGVKAAEKTKFLVIRKWSGGEKDDKGSTNADLFSLGLEGKIREQIQDELPCARVSSLEDVYAALGHERERQLLGVTDDGYAMDLAGAMGANYLISIQVSITGQNVFFFVKLLDPKKAETLINLMDKGTDDESAFEVANRLAKKFFEEVCKREICPYKGRIKVHVFSELKVDTKKEYPVYCQGMDRKYTLNFKENKTTDNFWTFEKESKVWARGFLDFTISEVTETEIDNGCYKCPSGDMYRRYYHDKITKTGSIDGLSEESELYGVRINDVRVEITFNDDETYTMQVKAASKLSEISETVYRYAEGWCDAINDPDKTVKNKIDIAMPYVFGPYKGSAKDKNLTQKPDPIVKIDPVSGEKTTIEVEFDLERD